MNKTLIHKLTKKWEQPKRSLSKFLTRLYRVTDNFFFNFFSNNRDNRKLKSPLKKGEKGDVLSLTVEDIMSERVFREIKEMIGSGALGSRGLGSFSIHVPALGADEDINTKFYELIRDSEAEYYEVWPVSFCSTKEGSTKEGSEWAIARKPGWNTSHRGYRVNVPKPRNS